MVEELTKFEWTLIGLKNGWFYEEYEPQLGSAVGDVIAIQAEEGIAPEEVSG